MRLLAAVSLLVVLTGCSSSEPSSAPEPSASPSASPSATAAPDPQVGECRQLAYDAATQPEDDTSPVDCGSSHTAETVKVGRLDTLPGGTDADAADVARACPTRLLRRAGGDETARRLSRLEVVWFVPTQEQVGAGAGWYRCDVVGIAASDRLIRLPRTVKGALDASDALDRFGTCGTKAPGKPGFERVVCRRAHTWRAVDVVEIDRSARYLGARPAAAGDAACKDVASARSGGALRYTWSFEWPTRDQWRAGQRYGYCWVPD